MVLAECDFGPGEMVEVTDVLLLGMFSNCSLSFSEQVLKDFLIDIS